MRTEKRSSQKHLQGRCDGHGCDTQVYASAIIRYDCDILMGRRVVGDNGCETLAINPRGGNGSPVCRVLAVKKQYVFCMRQRVLVWRCILYMHAVPKLKQ